MFVLNDITTKVRYYEQVEEISQYKDLLLATVTHDLKTPLIAVLNYNKLLKDELKFSQSEPYLEYLNIMESSSLLL